MKIVIIGTGNLGKSIAKGLVQEHTFESLYLTKRNIKALAGFSDQKGVIVTDNNIEAVKNTNILVFAVQPKQLTKILNEIKDELTKDHVLISTITGFSIQKIQELIGDHHTIIRAMPNTAIAVGKSMTCIASNTNDVASIAIAEAIFKTLGHTLHIEEHLMQAATVVCASGIAFWMRLIRATTQAAIQLGFDAKEAQELAMFTSQGAASLLIASGNHPEQEIDKVTTPKGCTIEGLNHMEHKGLSSSLIQGMVASFDKINTIKKEQI